MSSSVTCGKCGSSDIDFDQARGDTYCTKCGNVIDQNCIVAEVQFEEGTHGASHIIGQRHDAEGPFKAFSIGGILGAGRESRQLTLMNAKRRVKTVCDQLRLNDHFVDMAFNFYKMALNRRLTHGRKQIHVIAACIYITCRSEGTPHMLLDLSDVAMVNVYELGRTYLKLTSALCITIPAIDPSLYIIRFAQHLQLGEKTNADVEKLRNNIISTANRLVQRMKRDWMHYGRRPSGLCGAAILVAARLNQVHCSIKDIIKIVKVCETTIRKRLSEFSETPTSSLTLDEFMTIDLEGEEDPPCYKAAKRKQKMQQQIDGEQDMEEIQNKISQLQKLIDKDLEKSRKKLKNPYAKYLKMNTDTSEDGEVERVIVNETIGTIKEVLKSNDDDDNDEYNNYVQQLKALRPTAASLGIISVIKQSVSAESNQTDNTSNEANDELDLTGIDDDELDSYLLNQDEIKAKTHFWTTIHAEYLAELKVKEEKRAKEEAERKEKEASGEMPLKKKRKTRKRTQIQANSASEAIEKMLQEKRISNKINYDVLKNLNPTFGEKTPAKEDPKNNTPTISDESLSDNRMHSPLKRLTTLKNSASTSLLNLKAPLFNKLKLKEPEVNTSAVHVNSEPHKTSEHSVVNKTDDKEKYQHEEEQDFDDDDDYNCDEEQTKRKDLSIQELLGFEGDDNDFDNYEDYDDDYE